MTIHSHPVPLYAVEPNPNIQFKILYEDEELLVVLKPPRLPSQPGKGHEHDTLLNGLFALYGKLLQNLGAERDYGLLHRLDKNASGLLVVALRNRSYDALRKAFSGRTVRKYYWAVCAKTPKSASGVIRLPIAEQGGTPSTSRGPGTPKTARITKSGKPAVTAYRVLDSSPFGSLVEARPLTGRLHQVRVHLEAIGCPILGDEFYTTSAVRGASARLALHSHRLAFTHPTTGETVDVKSPWPSDLRRVLSKLKLHRPDLPPPGVKSARTAEAEAPGADLDADDAGADE